MDNPPRTPSGISPYMVAEELRDLLKLADDPEFERCPDPAELYLLLRHVERVASRLRQPRDCSRNVLGELSVAWAKLWGYLREQADPGQWKAVTFGRDARPPYPWRFYAEVFGVASEGGAIRRYERLEAGMVREPGERRSPEVAHAHRKRAAAEERAQRAQVVFNEARFPAALPIARELLEHRGGLVMDEWAAYWLGEISATVEDRTHPAEKARFVGWLESFTRAMQGHAAESGEDVVTSEGARRALAAAVMFTAGTGRFGRVKV